MIKINLNPEKRKRNKGLNLQFSISQLELSNYVYLGIFLAAIIGMIVYNFVLSSAIDDLIKEKQRLAQEKQKYQKVAAKIRQLNEEVAKLQSILNKLESRKLVYENLPLEKRLFLNMFSVISSSLPDGVWLNKIQLSRKNSIFQGFSFKPEYISYFYDNINKHYASVNFSSVKKKSNKINEYYTFRFSLSDFKLEKRGE